MLSLSLSLPILVWHIYVYTHNDILCEFYVLENVNGGKNIFLTNLIIFATLLIEVGICRHSGLFANLFGLTIK